MALSPASVNLQPLTVALRLYWLTKTALPPTASNQQFLIGAIPRALQEHRPAAVDGPVRKRRDLVGAQEGRGRVGDAKTVEREVGNRFLLGADDADDGLQNRHFHHGAGKIHARRRHEIENPRGRVQIPFAGRIEFFKDVLDEEAATRSRWPEDPRPTWRPSAVRPRQTRSRGGRSRWF